MPTSRFIWFSIPCLWIAGCVLERAGGLETSMSSGAGAAPPGCESDIDCAGTTCRPGRCVNAECRDEVAPEGTACDDDGGTQCDGMGACVRRDGTPCGSGTECSSGHCADGVCCDTSCMAVCETCVSMGNEGECMPFAAGSDPELDCSEGGICDGSSHCAQGEPLGVSLQFGDNYDQMGTAVALDALGNRFVTAGFVNSITFTTTHSSSPTNLDIAVAKLSPEGSPLWSRHFPGTGSDIAPSIATDGAGNVFVGGNFDNQLVIGSDVHASAGFADMFIAKLDASGNLVWSRRFGSVGVDVVAELELKNDGNVVITGSVSGPVSFDGGATTLAFSGGRDVVVAELASVDGALVWNAGMGGGALDDARGLTVDDDGNVYVSGLFQGTATFGANAFTATGDDAFLVKFDSGGEQQWAIQLGGSLNEVGRALETTDDGVVLAGEFTGTMTIGSTTWTTSDGSPDVFVAMLDETGNALWERALSGGGMQHAHEIAIDPSGNVVLAGAMQGSANAGSVVLVSAGGYDAYLLKLAADGTPLWGDRFGDAQDQSCDGVTVDDRGNSVATGWFRGTIDFGDGNPHASAGLTDMFVMARTP